MIRRHIEGSRYPWLSSAIWKPGNALPFGWGTGGIQVTASIIGIDDTLKVIDQELTTYTNR